MSLRRIIARTVLGKPKGKGLPSQGHEAPLSLTSALDVGGWLTPRRGRFTPGKDRVSIVYEAGWTTRPVCTGAENLAAAGFRF
jgi:hypothetical protein